MGNVRQKKRLNFSVLGSLLLEYGCLLAFLALLALLLAIHLLYHLQLLLDCNQGANKVGHGETAGLFSS